MTVCIFTANGNTVNVMLKLILVHCINNFKGFQLCYIFRNIDGQSIFNGITNSIVGIIACVTTLGNITLFHIFLQIRLMVINRHGIVIVNYKIAVRGSSIRRYKLTLIINFKLICHIVVDNIAAFLVFCIANFHKTVFTLEQILNGDFATAICCKLAFAIYSIIIVFILAR